MSPFQAIKISGQFTNASFGQLVNETILLPIQKALPRLSRKQVDFDWLAHRAVELYPIPAFPNHDISDPEAMRRERERIANQAVANCKQAETQPLNAVVLTTCNTLHSLWAVAVLGSVVQSSLLAPSVQVEWLHGEMSLQDALGDICLMNLNTIKSNNWFHHRIFSFCRDTFIRVSNNVSFLGTTESSVAGASLRISCDILRRTRHLSPETTTFPELCLAIADALPNAEQCARLCAIGEKEGVNALDSAEDRLNRFSAGGRNFAIGPGAMTLATPVPVVATPATPPAQADASEKVADAAASKGPAASPVKVKRSTERGEGRAKLIAFLTKHHKYADGGCLNLEPIGNNALAAQAGVSPSTASTFFTDKFLGHTKYRLVCRDAGKLADSLKALNGEFSPHDLYGRRPANEDDRDDNNE